MNAPGRTDDITTGLYEPDQVVLRDDASAQSLGAGMLGVALLHFEHARTGRAPIDTARTWLRACAYPNVNCAFDTNLFNGGPALAFLLHTTAAPERYETLRARLHERTKHIISERLTLAHERIRRQQPTGFAEYSTLSGLTGLGAYLLATEPDHPLTTDVQAYLVELTKPLRLDEALVPGWWSDHDPFMKVSPEFPGGHANLGAAHGIAGPLACLAAGLRAGITVPGHREAIERICDLYDTWQHETGWWPQWLTRLDIDTGHSSQHGPGRPSWCYGAPGIARSLQLAAIALDDPRRQRRAETALLHCLNDEAQQASLADAGLCHGIAGLYRITQRAAADAVDDRLAEPLHGLHVRLLDAAPADGSFLDGAAGLALTLDDAGTPIPDDTTWDAALLIDAPTGPSS
jgi:hypothetical protein